MDLFMNALELQKKLKEAMTYDPDTGVCVWLARPISHFSSEHAQKVVNSRLAGKVAGNKVRHGSKEYFDCTFQNKMYRLHRLIWVLVNGEMPNAIDHINGNGLDNRLVNLRNVSAGENRKNIKSRSYRQLPSGIYLRASGRFIARIKHEGQKVNLGTFDTLEQAMAAREVAKSKYGYHPNHGSF